MILVDDLKKLDELIKVLKQQMVFACDTEYTPDVASVKAELLVISFAWHDNSAVIPCGIFSFREEKGKELLASMVAEKLKPIMEDPRVIKAMHNSKADMHLFANYGVRVRGSFCTMIASFLCDENTLKTLKVRAAEVGMVLNEWKTEWKKSVPEFLAYADRDAVATFKLYKLYKKRLKEEGLYDVFKKQENRLVPIVMQMERRGVLIDVDFLKKADKGAQKEIDSLEGQIYKLAGKTFNIGSPAQLGEVLYNEIGLEPVKVTKGGKASTDAESLEAMEGKHKIVPLLLRHRRLAKLVSVYIGTEGLRSFLVGNKLHCNFNTVGTTTGRFACSAPNLQTLPRADEQDPSPWFHVRKAFIAPKGHKLIVADYDQIELKVLAHYSGDRRMLEAIRAGKDLHQAAADAIGLPGKEGRQIAKSIMFSVAYGSGPRNIANKFNLPLEKAKHFLEVFYQKYSGVQVWKTDIVSLAKRQGYIRLLTGRKRRVEGLTSDDWGLKARAERQVVNSAIQASSADIVKCAMLEMVKDNDILGYGYKMLLQVHDELVGVVAEREAEQAAERVKYVMEHCLTVPLRVNITATVGIGNDWESGKA